MTRSLRARPASLSSSQSGISSTATARLRRMVWVALPRLRLSCESERLSFADCLEGRRRARGERVGGLRRPTISSSVACEYLGQVDGPDAGAQAVEAAADVHQARVVPGRADLGLGVEDAPDLVREHRGRGVRVLDREGPAEPATLLGLGELDEVDAPHVPQELQRRVPDLQHPQASGTSGGR